MSLGIRLDIRLDMWLNMWEEQFVDSKTVGILVGLLLGLAFVLEGFGEMLIVALFGAIGYVVSRVVEGELDLSQYLGGGRRQ